MEDGQGKPGALAGENMPDMAETPDAPSRKSANRVTWRVMLLVALLGVGIFAVLGVRLYEIQVNLRGELQGKANAQHTDSTGIDAVRGSIYDRNMNLLASSQNAETVGIDPSNIENDAQASLIAKGLSEILDIDHAVIYEATKKQGTKNVTVARKIDKEKADEVRAFIVKNGFSRMIKTEPDSKRYYVYSNLAAQVIGFVGSDNRGLDGLESKYDALLTGTSGHIVAVNDRSGQVAPLQYEMVYDVSNGKSLVLTLDETVQRSLERHLEMAMRENSVQNRGCGIVMDVKTGAILGMATKGDYDLNNYQAVSDKTALAELAALSGEEYRAYLAAAQRAQWRNKAVSDPYEPGSTFKIFTAAIAVEEKAVDIEKDIFVCTGIVHDVGGFDIRCHKRNGHGSLTFAETICNSCNPAYIAIGAKVGAAKFYHYMRAFGFMERTGIDVMGEASNLGLFHTWEAFSTQVSTQATYAFGQTFKITPIQLITAVAAVANGGYLMQPYIVGEAIGGNGARSAVNTPTVVRQVISAETSKLMCALLEGVVSEGTGKNAYVKGYRVAGKTGTSQKRDLWDKNGNDISEGKYVVSFVGFAPADDPQVAVLIVLDEPGGPASLRSGGYMAAPVAGRIFADVLPYLGVAPRYSDEELSARDIKTPGVTGKALSQAIVSLTNIGLDYKIYGEGSVVVSQIPVSGIALTAASKVMLFTEAGLDDMEPVLMPDLTGKTFSQANAILADLGLFMRPTGAFGTDDAALKAAFQAVSPGESTPFGSIIEVEFRDNSVDDAGSVSGRRRG
ncbi:MAG: hypothetical protein LBI44_02535 [Oscillospiraceae bacterium]|jgi:stage V sporulation protein D (sporulation-specific penicillin-binding protein)|nr:hypothetical protein [Oscillospiraceae bacterium]